MEFFTDWKFWLFAVTILGSIMNWLANQKLMNNHLHHLAIDVKSIKDSQDSQGRELNEIKTEVAYIKGIKESEDKVIHLLEKKINNQ